MLCKRARRALRSLADGEYKLPSWAERSAFGFDQTIFDADESGG
jgi:hypothetical protein